MAEEEKHHEIVIIRRGGHGDHDEHHGGVWKIAFADFMTAMMAFFLVMWLISANDKTRASVARYFNPVRLVDATTQPRGLHDPKKDESGITASPDTKKPANDKGDTKNEAAQVAPQKETPAQKEKRLDGALRDNPLAALAEIASTSGQGDHGGGAMRAAPPVIGRRGGERSAILSLPRRRHWRSGRWGRGGRRGSGGGGHVASRGACHQDRQGGGQDDGDHRCRCRVSRRHGGQGGAERAAGRPA